MLAGTARNTISLLPSAVVINDESQDVDFRVESDGNANMLFVDGGNNAVGIGTATPNSFNTTGAKFVVAGANGAVTSLFSDSTNFTLGIKHAGSGAYGMFGGTSGSGVAFMTNNLERARIDTSGNLSLGHTTSTGAKFAICDGANAQIQFFPEVTTDTNLIQHYDVTSTTYMNADYRAATHKWTIGASEKMRLDASGNLGIGVTPEANWRSTVTAIDLGATGAFWDGHNYSIFANNVYEHTDTNRKHKQAGFGSSIEQYLGTISFNTTTSGSADATISGSTTMFLNTDGKVAIGTTNPLADLHIRSTANTSTHLRLERYESDEALTTGDIVGDIEFYANDGSVASNATTKVANIDVEILSTALQTALTFNTYNTSLAERMRITNLGDVGIQTPSPDGKLHVKDSGGTSTALVLEHASNDVGKGAFLRFQASNQAGTIVDYGQIKSEIVNRGTGGHTGTLRFYTATGGGLTEKMSITATGNLLVGATSATVGASSGTFVVGFAGNVANGIKVYDSYSSAATNNALVFIRGSSEVGTITTTTSATAYNTSSDARLKDVTGKARGLEVINALNPVAYNWKADGKADEGLIAQEVLDIVPNAVSGSEEDMYQMDYSKLVVHLVKAVKEQQEQIELLTTEINNLKGE